MPDSTTTPRPLVLVNAEHATKVELIAPSANGFLVLAGETGRWVGPFTPPSRWRRRLIARARRGCATLADRSDIVEAVVFRGALRPPGEGAELLNAAGVRPARYDVVVLVRTTTADALDGVRSDPAFRELADAVRAESRHTYEFRGGERRPHRRRRPCGRPLVPVQLLPR